MTYYFNGESDSVEISCSNYTFGLPKLYWTFEAKHGEIYRVLEKSSSVKGVRIHSFYNDRWMELSLAGSSIGNKTIEVYKTKD